MPILYSTGNSSLPEIINVEKAVGRNCPNSPEDVKLVQFLLKKIFTAPKWIHFLGSRPVSGVCDEMTIAWIYFFQTSVRALGGSCVADERVDRMTGALGPVHHQVYTILNLNSFYAQFYPLEFANSIKGTGGVPTGKLLKVG
jgi:hypothetical protein